MRLRVLADRFLVVSLIALAGGCAVADEAYVRMFGGYTNEEMTTCVNGVGGEVAIALRGKAAAAQYCTCKLTKLSEKYPFTERRRLASDTYVTEYGLLGLGSAEYTDWVSANTSASASCMGSIVDPDAQR